MNSFRSMSLLAQISWSAFNFCCFQIHYMRMRIEILRVRILRPVVKVHISPCPYPNDFFVTFHLSVRLQSFVKKIITCAKISKAMSKIFNFSISYLRICVYICMYIYVYTSYVYQIYMTSKYIYIYSYIYIQITS